MYGEDDDSDDEDDEDDDGDDGECVVDFVNTCPG